MRTLESWRVADTTPQAAQICLRERVPWNANDGTRTRWKAREGPNDGRPYARLATIAVEIASDSAARLTGSLGTRLGDAYGAGPTLERTLTAG